MVEWTDQDKRDALLHPIKTFFHRSFSLGERKYYENKPCPNCNHTVSIPHNGYIYAKTCLWCGCILQLGRRKVIAYENDGGTFGDVIDSYVKDDAPEEISPSQVIEAARVVSQENPEAAQDIDVLTLLVRSKLQSEMDRDVTSGEVKKMMDVHGIGSRLD